MSDVLRLVTLISGRGSNMVALADACEGSDLMRMAAVISNEPLAAGLALANARGIATGALDHRDYATRQDFDQALSDLITSYEPGLVVLAGFMRILTPGFVERWAGRLLNIHPSLLPLYPGLHTHARALADGATEHGATVHFVTAELDGGPAVAQARVAVRPGDDEAALAARVLQREHQLLPQVVQWFAEGRLSLANGQVVFDRQRLTAPMRLAET